MRVILTERVPSLGNVGEIVKVSAGFGRNFLLPRGFAVVADEANKAQQVHLQKRLAKKIQAEKVAAEELKTKLEKVKLEVSRKVGGSGKLFGTVTSQEISKLLEEKGFEVPRRQISVETPVKSIGTFNITAHLFDGVDASFKLVVEMDAKQAQEELEKAERKARAAKEKKTEDVEASANADESIESEEMTTEE